LNNPRGRDAADFAPTRQVELATASDDARRDAGHRASAATNRAGKIGASRRVSAKIAG